MSLPRLDRTVARRLAGVAPTAGPQRVLQIGSGNFLRAFSAWMIDRMNQRGLFHGSVVIAQATPHSKTTEQLNAQQGCYTVLQRGLRDGRMTEQIDVVGCVSRAINPFADWRGFLELAACPDLRFVISNTTEAGIAYTAQQPRPDAAPATFPAQMAALLRHRVERLAPDAPGLVFLPCELIERPGDHLRECVRSHLHAWGCGSALLGWLDERCIFCNTLVDRIVSGYPAGEVEAVAVRLGYDDRLLVACELYHNWIIEGPPALARELPLAEAGLNVTWVSDVEPYRTRKVRILNAPHTLMASVAFLAGCDTVREAIEHPLTGAYVRRALFDEILPTLKLQAPETHDFARDALERFGNPAIHHGLLSIALNCTSKWKVRVLPALRDFASNAGRVPPLLTFSLAALIRLYRARPAGEGLAIGHRGGAPYELRDTRLALALLARAWHNYDETGDARALAWSVLSARELWGADLTTLPELTSRVVSHLERMEREGLAAALQNVLNA